MKKLFYCLSFILVSTAAVAQCDSSSWIGYDSSNSGLINNRVNCLMTDYNIIWIAQGSGIWPDSSGLSKFDGTSWTSYKQSNSGLPSNTIFSLCAYNAGTIWVGTDMGLARFDGSTWVIFNTGNSAIADNVIHTIGLDWSGNIWVGTTAGISVFDGSSIWTSYSTANSGLPDNNVKAMAIDHANNIWIGGESGAVKYNQTANTWTLYNTTNSGIPGNSVSSIEEDHNNNMWFGFGLGFHGVAMYDGTNWNYYYPFTDVNYTWVPYNSIRVDVFNNVWVGSECEGLFYYDGWQWIHCTPSTPTPNFNCSSLYYAIAFDSNNRIWYGDAQSGVWTMANPSGVEENNLSNERIKVYPNPVSNNLTIEISTTQQEKKELCIYNTLGQEVVKKSFSSQKQSIDVSALVSGVYFVEVRGEKGAVRRKVVKM